MFVQAGVAGDDEASAERRGQTALPSATYKLAAALFDVPFYLEAYPDVRESGVDPIVHYLGTGWKEQRNPSPTFSTSDYLNANPDVQAASACPLVHYVTSGALEGRAPYAKQGAEGLPPRRPHNPARNALNSAVPLAQRVKPWLLFSTIQPLEDSALEQALNALRKPQATGLVISLSHDDYATVAGGVQGCVGGEESVLRDRGWDYLHLCPVQPLPVLAEPTAADGFFVWVRLNGQRLGAVSVAGLVEKLGLCDFSGRRRMVVLHHLMGFCPEHVAAIAGAFAPDETIAWTHDFFTLCPSYALLRNNVTFCGGPSPDSQACRICAYGGEERKRHLQRMERLFEDLRPTVLAPSQTALIFWLGHGRLAHRAAKAIPLGTLAMEPDLRPVRISDEPHLRVGFVGFPSYHKGWHVFQELAVRHYRDCRYSFFHLASARSNELSNIEFVEVLSDRGQRHAMIEAVVANQIDVVVNWSLCYETFSFTAHEAVAGGAFVLAPKSAGNIVPAISQKGVEQGLGLETEQELFDMFAGGKVFEVAARRRYGEFTVQAGTARYLEGLA